MKAAAIEKVCALLEKNKAVRQQWSGVDELVIENQLPYLCLYRYAGEPDEDFIKIVKTQPSYLIVSGDRDVKELLHGLADIISSKMNAFMLLELWPGYGNSKTFKIYCPQGKAPSTIAALEQSLEVFGKSDDRTRVKLILDEVGSPPKMEPIASTLEESLQIGFLPIALEIPPLYRQKDSDLPQQIRFRGIRSLMADAIKKAAFEFLRVQTPVKFNQHLMLGKTRISEAALEIDEHLTQLTNRIDFLLRVTPVNIDRQWELFRKKKEKENPHFSYRLITLDPEAEKRGLYQLRLSKVGDPALSFILREKRLELDKQLTMLEERGTRNFRYLSQSLFGVPSARLVGQAEKLLQDLKGKKASGGKKIDSHQFADLATREVEIFEKHFDGLKLDVEIRKDISSLMVSKNTLLIGDKMEISKKRAEALIQHEVGTHMLTFCNGQRQVLGQLASGFAGYDDLQEGLAVLAEYLVGGLTGARMRILAARVLAVDALVKGADFVQVYQRLCEKSKLSERRAFHITARVMRGGGLTKDAVYLSGLLDLLDYLRDGGELDLLFTGKFSFRHIPLIRELLHRDVLKKPFLPTYFGAEEVQKRINAARLDMNLIDLING